MEKEKARIKIEELVNKYKSFSEKDIKSYNEANTDLTPKK